MLTLLDNLLRELLMRGVVGLRPVAAQPASVKEEQVGLSAGHGRNRGGKPRSLPAGTTDRPVEHQESLSDDRARDI